MSGKDRMRQIQVLDERGQILQGKLGGEGDIVRSRFAVGAHVPHNRALARRGQGLELCVEHVVIRAGTVRQHDRVPRPSSVRVSEHASRSVKPTSQIYHLLYIPNNLKLSLGSPDKLWDAVAGTHRKGSPYADRCGAQAARHLGPSDVRLSGLTVMPHIVHSLMQLNVRL